MRAATYISIGIAMLISIAFAMTIPTQVSAQNVDDGLIEVNADQNIRRHATDAIARAQHIAPLRALAVNVFQDFSEADMKAHLERIGWEYVNVGLGEAAYLEVISAHNEILFISFEEGKFDVSTQLIVSTALDLLRTTDNLKDVQILRIYIESDIQIYQNLILSELRGQSYDAVAALVETTGYDMIQKTDTLHVFTSDVHSMNFVFVGGKLSHITNNCVQAPETCDGGTQ